MPTQPDEFLFFQRNRLFADVLANGTDRVYRVHLGAVLRVLDISFTVDDLAEVTDPSYLPVERTSETIVNRMDGRVYLELPICTFDFGAGPVAPLSVNWGWITYACAGVSETNLGAFALPFTYLVDADNPTFRVTPRVRIGLFAKGDMDCLPAPE